MINEIDKILKDKVVGAQLYVYNKGKEFKYSYGKASILNNKDVNDNTIFRLASISKVIVAMCALKLVETNKLNLEADISSYLGYLVRNPKYPEVVITVKMLMLHTSSILDGYDDEDIEHDGVLKGYNGVNGKKYYVLLKDLLTNKDSKYYTKKTFADYAPGEVSTYSNFCTGILACIIEACSGKLFTEFVKENIFEPLNIDASFKANEIKGKDLISDTFIFNKLEGSFTTNITALSFINSSYEAFKLKDNFRGPAGGSYMSMQDLGKIMQVLMHDGTYQKTQILKKETVDLMLQTHFLSNVEKLARGLQIKIVDRLESLTIKGHTGSAYGVRSLMFLEKDANFGLCFIINGGSYVEVSSDFNDIQDDILKLCYKHFYVSNQNVVTITKDLDVFFNERRVVLNKGYFQDDSIYVSLMDLANILDVIPYKTKDGAIIKEQEIFFVGDEISLDECLKSLNINFKKDKRGYTIYL